MIVSGPGGLVDTDPMIEQMMWDTEPQWENDDDQDDHEGCFIEEINEEEFEEVEEIDCKNEIGDTCECHVCTAPASGTSGPSSEPLLPAAPCILIFTIFRDIHPQLPLQPPCHL